MAAQDSRPPTDVNRADLTRAERLARKRRRLAERQGLTETGRDQLDLSKVFDRRLDDQRTVAERLAAEPYRFNFFQAVRLLAMLRAEGTGHRPHSLMQEESVRFVVHQSSAFPASAIQSLEPGDPGSRRLPRMAVNFFGLTGPSGVLPDYYNELIFRIGLYDKHAEKHALRDWFDLFNHRMLVLFQRSWEKYRFWVAYERLEHLREEPDPFTHSLLALVGLGTPGLRNRLHVSRRPPADEHSERHLPLAEVNDQSILYYGAHYAQMHRSAVGLELLLSDYFRMPIGVQQFQGEWLKIEPADLLRLGQANARLGSDSVLGERVWDCTGKIRLRVGPLDYKSFVEFLPDRAATSERKGLFVLGHLTRLYLGCALDYDCQLVVRRREVPTCRLGGKDPLGSRLGWNSWLLSRVPEKDADQAIFPGTHVVWVD